MQLSSTLFSRSSKNKKKNPPQENFLCSNIKKLLIFSQKKAVLIFQETESTKEILMFQEMELSYLRKRNCLIFRERYIQNPSIFRTRSTFRIQV